MTAAVLLKPKPLFKVAKSGAAVPTDTDGLSVSPRAVAVAALRLGSNDACCFDSGTGGMEPSALRTRFAAVLLGGAL